MAAALGSRLPGAARVACRGSVSDAFVLRVSGAIAGPRRCSTATRRVATMASKAKFFVGGNWKCNGTKASVAQLVQDLNAGAPAANVDVVCAPTLLHLAYVQQHLAPRYQIAAQNCWQKGSGAYTGEVSAEMLKDAGVPWVILGHSERRALCGESNELVGAKTAKALAEGVSVIACIGETLEQRNGGSMFTVLDAQLSAIAANVKDWSRVVLAYEPVWAIGTGVVASPQQAQEVHAYLRLWMSGRVNAETAATTRIIYGGSVNDANCAELAREADIDGFLVGGASLKAAAFLKICNAQA